MIVGGVDQGMVRSRGLQGGLPRLEGDMVTTKGSVLVLSAVLSGLTGWRMIALNLLVTLSLQVPGHPWPEALPVCR